MDIAKSRFVLQIPLEQLLTAIKGCKPSPFPPQNPEDNDTAFHEQRFESACSFILTYSKFSDTRRRLMSGNPLTECGV
nr:hypothetical transcript [Hymenolepis microstoma]